MRSSMDESRAVSKLQCGAKAARFVVRYGTMVPVSRMSTSRVYMTASSAVGIMWKRAAGLVFRLSRVSLPNSAEVFHTQPAWMAEGSACELHCLWLPIAESISFGHEN